MIRIFAILALIAGSSYLADFQLHRNCQAVEDACSKKKCLTLARMATDAEPVVQSIHHAERFALLAIAGVTVLAMAFRNSIVHEFLATLWGLGLCAVVFMLVGACCFEMLADGMEIQHNFRPPWLQSAALSAFSDMVSIVATLVLGFVVGPPCGWEGDSTPELI